jgi:uncharacterized protein (DUF58 family)
MDSFSLGLLSAVLEGRGSDRAWRQEKDAVGQHGRFFWSVLMAVCLFAALSIGLHPATAAAQNPIVVENQQPGTSAWQIQGNTGSDAVGQIKAYMSATSVNKGGSIDFHVNVNPAQTYTIDVYRLGWYQGLGGRLMQHVTGLNGTTQPTCPVDATTGLIECNWAVGYTLTTQTSWTSGLYVAVLTNSQNYQNWAHFVVRDDSRVAPLNYQVPDNTYEAYNDYPQDNLTGKSLYSFNSYGAKTVGGTTGAVKVSFDRPYNSDGDCGAWGFCVFGQDYAFIRWLEKSGYDVTYSSDVDAHTNGAGLLNYRGLIRGGHNEYWTKGMYDNFIAARDGGVNIGIFSANTNYWQVRYESSSSGVSNRVIVCYRDATIDPTTVPSLTTINWRDPILNRPEQTLIGVMYTDIVDANSGNYAPYVVLNSGNWVYAGTGFKDGDSVTGVVGYEADRLFSEYPGPTAVAGTYTLLSHSPFKSSGVSDYSNSSVYQATSGAWVFGSGTINWANALDSFSFSGGNIVDARIQQTTVNILGRFISGTPQGDFTLAGSPASQTVTPGGPTSYGVTITPNNGFTGQVTLSVTGLPTGASGSFAPNPATSTSTLSVTTGSNTPPGTYTLTITGISGSLTHTAAVTLVVSASPDFTLGASPSSQTVIQGGPTSYGVTVTPTNGFTGQVTLSVSGLPTGANGSFSPNPTTGSSTLSVTTGASTPVGSYTVTVTGVSGALTHTATVTLIVSIPDFALSASPSSQTITQGRSTTYGVTITPALGFAGQVTLSVSGLPTGATGSFSPNPATASSTLSVTTIASTAVGTYTLTITGVSGALMHTTTVSLTVAPAGVVYDNKVSAGFDFGITRIITPAFTIGTGPNRAAMIMVAMSANTATNITASLGGVNATLIPGTDSGTTASGRTMIFQVINPPSGSQNATVSWTGSTNADVGVITVTGADQINPTNNGTSFASNSSAAATTSVTITSNPGDLTASIGFTGDNWKSPFTNQTLKWGVDSGVAGGDIGPGTGTTTHTWTDDYAGQLHAVSGANFKATSASDFTLSATPSTQTVTHGNPTSYGVTVSPMNGFTGQVTLSVSGLPTGAGGTFTSNPTTSTSSLSVTTDATTTPAGTYTLTITGVSGGLTHTTTVTLVVTAPDFTLSPSPASQTVAKGSGTSYGVTINPTNGFAGQVTLSLTGLPTGAGGSFSPNPATSTSTLSVTTDATTTPAGTYTLTITGVSGSLTHTTTVTLVVTAPDFSLSPSPASQTVIQGNPTSYGVTVNPTNGFAGQVALSVTGLPTGASGSFAPNPATSTSTLSVTTDATTTPAGTYTLTITGVSGSLTHTATVTLVVTAPDFTLSRSPASQTVIQGNPTSYGVTINPTNGFAGQVTLSVTGLPTGAGGSFSPNPATTTSTLSVTTIATTPAGTYTLTITGVSGGLTHTATVTLVVAASGTKQATTTALSSSLNPSFVGQAVTFTATVTSAAGGTPTGTVTFKQGSTVLGTGTLSSGQATFTTSSLAAGTKNYTAAYGGDANYKTSTSTALSQTVNKRATTTTVTSSLNPSTYGQTVVFAATVSSTAGAPPDGETVTFKRGTTTIGTGTLSGGIATFSTNALTAGAPSITAQYAADSAFLGSTSAALTQTVSKAATTASLVSAPNPSPVGQLVTFTATLTSSTGAIPTGSVSFKQGGTTLGTGTLNATGTATFSTSTLTAGSHVINAVYAATTNFSGSTSTSVTQVVQ